MMGYRMVYLKLLLIFIWLALGFIVAVALAIVRFGDLDLNYRVGRLLSWGVFKISGLRVQVVSGQEHLSAHQPCIYVANHQSGMDIMTFGSIFPHRGIVIAKRELLWTPLLGLYLVAAGNILINRQKRSAAVAAMEIAVKKIREKNASIWLFPEGTRNRTEQPLLPFKKGAFYMAIAGQVPIVPVVSASLKPMVSWKNKRLLPGVVKVAVLPAVSTKGLKTGDAEQLALEVRRKMEEAFLGLAT